MKISNAFMPLISDDHKRDYYFALTFPMSICACIRDKDFCIIGAGDGDYRSIAYELPIKNILQSCIHDVQKMGFR